MKPHDFDDIYHRYLSIPAVQQWLNLREPVGRLGEYLQVEDPMLLGVELATVSEPGVKSPKVGDLYLVHSICKGFALGITLAKQVETYELLTTVQSVYNLKMPEEANKYSDKIVVRRFAVDLQRTSKSLEMLEYSWLEDGGLVTQAKFTVVRQFPFPMTSHSEHRFWRPPDAPYDMPSKIYARMILREMSAPRCDVETPGSKAPCKFCMVYGRMSCCCPRTFRDRLGKEKMPIKCVRVLTGGTWSGYKGVFERAQLAGVVRVKWILGDRKGTERNVICSCIPYKCHVGSPQEINDLIRKFCLWTGQYREAPHMDCHHLRARADDGVSFSSLLLPAPISGDDGDVKSGGKTRAKNMPLIVEVTPARNPSVYEVTASDHTSSTQRADDSLSHAKDYSIASVKSQHHNPFSTCMSDSQSRVNFSIPPLPSVSAHSQDSASYRSTTSSRKLPPRVISKGPLIQGGVVKRCRPYSPPQKVRLSPVTGSPSQSCNTIVHPEVDEGASRLLLMRSGALSAASHPSMYSHGSAFGPNPSSQSGTAESCATLVTPQPTSVEQGSIAQHDGLSESALGRSLMPHAIVDGKGKQANWKCHLCGQTFKGKRGNLNRHYHVVHGKERRFVCKYPGCGQRFGYRLNQQRHYQNVHESRKFKCDRCDQAFKTEEKLDIHVKVIHEKLEKPYICPICPNAAFGRKSSLTRHMTNLHKNNAQTNAKSQNGDAGPCRVVSTGTPPLKVCM